MFSKAGVLLIGDDGEPRIKLYYDESGIFKGDALVMYFKEGSVQLAVTLFDDSELEIGAGYPAMRVKTAEYDKSHSREQKEKNGQDGQTGQGGQGDQAGQTNVEGESRQQEASGSGDKKRGPTKEEKAESKL